MIHHRVILIVIDGCGVGELPDAYEYGDVGSATIPNIAHAVGGLYLPELERMGLGNIVEIEGVPPVRNTAALWGKMGEKASGKDSTSGHWELAGLTLSKPFPVFPGGFPRQLVEEFEQLAGVKTIGNVTASGTEIIERFGERHLQTGELILYTSADSVFQLAAHESRYPPERLYAICEKARIFLREKYGVGRVIARPFIGSPGNFQRTPRRRDFSLPPPSETILDLLKEQGHSVLAIGKIFELFNGRGITSSIKTSSNKEAMERIIKTVESEPDYSLIFANLCDFDEHWGHRNDVAGFAHGLEDFDNLLSMLLSVLCQDDLLMITADHGCDPTIKTSTDHTREYVPLLVYGQFINGPMNTLGVRDTFSDVACTIADLLEVHHEFDGQSFYQDIIGDKRRS